MAFVDAAVFAGASGGSGIYTPFPANLAYRNHPGSHGHWLVFLIPQKKT
jgi:hypothetical protein